MKKDEIRNANRKDLPKFLLVLALCMVVGGAVGYGSAKYGLDQMAGTFKDAGAFFGMHIAPWLMVALVVIQFAVLFSTGVAMWYANRAWVNICLIIPFIPMMIVGTVLLRKCFKKTGTIYFGAFLMALVSTLIMVANANTILRIR